MTSFTGPGLSQGAFFLKAVGRLPQKLGEAMQTLWCALGRGATDGRVRACLRHRRREFPRLSLRVCHRPQASLRVCSRRSNDSDSCGYIRVRLHADTVEEHVLLGSFLHTVVGLKRTWDQKLVLCIDEWSIAFGHQWSVAMEAREGPTPRDRLELLMSVTATFSRT